MIGDGRYDVEAGLAAGMKTVWVTMAVPAISPLPWCKRFGPE